VLAKLRRQATEAAAWRDKCLRYFQTFSKRPLPATIGPAPPTEERAPAASALDRRDGLVSAGPVAAEGEP
jgi:hypothetical protein